MAGVAAHTPGMRMPVSVPYHPFQCIPLVPLPFNIITHSTQTNPHETNTMCHPAKARDATSVSSPWRLDHTGKTRIQLPTQLRPLNRIAPPPPPTHPQAVLECPALRTAFHRK